MYPDAAEVIPDNMPPPLGQKVLIRTYHDSDFAHDLVNRRPVTGVLIFLNNMLFESYSKRQNTVETSTFGAEFVAAKVAVEMTISLRYQLRMLGVPVEDEFFLVSDNASVIINSSLPSSTLKKKHNAVAYHKVRECVAAGFIKRLQIPSASNISDVLTKPLGPMVHHRLVYSYLLMCPYESSLLEGSVKLNIDTSVWKEKFHNLVQT